MTTVWSQFLKKNITSKISCILPLIQNMGYGLP